MVIEPIINMHKIKYAHLNPIVQQAFDKGDIVNIYMNLDIIFKYFYTPKISDAIKSFDKDDYIALVSELINIVAHYRHFFWKTYNVGTRFYFYYGKNRPTYNVGLVPSYMEKINEQRSSKNQAFALINTFLKDNLSLFELCIKYIPDAYYIEAGNMDPSMVPYYIMKKFSKYPDTVHLLLTKDIYELQLLAHFKCAVIRLKYDNNTLITPQNMYQYICDATKAIYTPSSKLHPGHIVTIMAASGVKTRDVKGIKGNGFVTMLKKVESAIADGRLINTYFANPEPLADILIDSSNREQFINNYHVIDLVGQYINISAKHRDNIESALVNRYDNDSLMKLNDEYFPLNPIDLMYLMEGAEFIGNWTRHNQI